MKLTGLELFAITKSDEDDESKPVLMNNLLYMDRQEALYHANEVAIAFTKDMVAEDALCGDTRKWTVEHDDDGASVFLDEAPAYRFEVQQMIVVG
jgi:hypothetical protein